MDRNEYGMDKVAYTPRFAKTGVLAESWSPPDPLTLILNIRQGNIAAPAIIIFTVNIGGVIIAEASLSFLGFGLPPDVPGWGGMLSREGRQYMEMAPRLALWPGLCLTIVVYSLNMFGDAVRDLLDPRLRGGGRLGADAGDAGSV